MGIGCQKGGRECNFPEPIPTAKSSASRKRERTRPREGSSSLDELDGENEASTNGKSKTACPTVFGAQQLEVTYNNHKQSFSTEPDRDTAVNMSPCASASERPVIHSLSTQPDGTFTGPEFSTIAPTTGPLYQFSFQPSMNSGLPPGNVPTDLQPWLLYHIHRLTFHHYLLKCDNTSFFKTKFIDYAVRNEALLYAVASFSAFHWSVVNKNGSCHMFLEFYNTAVQKLRKSIADGEYTMAMLITILQLASFEVST